MSYLEFRGNNIKIDEFLNTLKGTVAVYSDLKDSLEHVLIIAHTDADGYASAALLSRMLERDGIPHTVKYYNRTGTWRDYLNSILPDFDKYGTFAIFFADIGAEVREIGRVFRENNDMADVFILDHHNMTPPAEGEIPENIHVVNPTLFGLDGLKEIAGSALCYLFIKNVSITNIKYAWIALIGINGDSLMVLDRWRSFNREILEDAVNEEQVIIKKGLTVYGATHESVKNALAYSVLPFIKSVGANLGKASHILEKLDITPSKKVEDLTEDEVKKIDDYFPENLSGSYLIFPKKTSVLRYGFEHAMAISLAHHKFPSRTPSLIAERSLPAEIKKEYTVYIKFLAKNLNLFVRTPKEYTEYAIFVDADKRIPVNYWSDVASYASVNGLYSEGKVLFLGGPDNNVIKLSVRCREEFPYLKRGIGADKIISVLQSRFGGMGGGHMLAGGYKLAPNRYKKLKREFDAVFKELISEIK